MWFRGFQAREMGMPEKMVARLSNTRTVDDMIVVFEMCSILVACSRRSCQG